MCQVHLRKAARGRCPAKSFNPEIPSSKPSTGDHSDHSCSGRGEGRLGCAATARCEREPRKLTHRRSLGAEKLTASAGGEPSCTPFLFFKLFSHAHKIVRELQVGEEESRSPQGALFSVTTLNSP